MFEGVSEGVLNCDSVCEGDDEIDGVEDGVTTGLGVPDPDGLGVMDMLGVPVILGVVVALGEPVELRV